MAVTVEDVDRLLDSTALAPAAPDVPVERIRTWRDELAHAAVLLAYARHVLSVDLHILREAMGAPGTSFGDIVESLPETLASASLGGGWSLSPDAPATMHAAERLPDGEADGLLALHRRLVDVDVAATSDLALLVAELEAELEAVTQRWETAEARVRVLQAHLVAQYKSGRASADDWLR
jgi:hypothetical protein